MPFRLNSGNIPAMFRRIGIACALFALTACSHPEGYVERLKWIPQECGRVVAGGGGVGMRTAGCIPGHYISVWEPPAEEKPEVFPMPEPPPDIKVRELDPDGTGVMMSR